MALPRKLQLHPDRLLPAEPATRGLARELYDSVRDLPIVSPHGHCDPAWFAGDAPWANASELLLVPDHYLFRMLYSQGVRLEDLGIGSPRADPREGWRLFAERYHLFRGTPSRIWLDWVFAEGFGIDVRLDAETSDLYYDTITDALQRPEFRPRALFERFNIETLATTESPLDPLDHHKAIHGSGWNGRVITAYRPDPVIDPEFEGFQANLDTFSQLTGEDCRTWQGYLAATASAGPISPGWAPRAPTTAIRPRRPPTSRRPMPRRCSAKSPPALSPPRKRSCSARKCSPKWPE